MKTVTAVSMHRLSYDEFRYLNYWLNSRFRNNDSAVEQTVESSVWLVKDEEGKIWYYIDTNYFFILLEVSTMEKITGINTNSLSLFAEKNRTSFSRNFLTEHEIPGE